MYIIIIILSKAQFKWDYKSSFLSRMLRILRKKTSKEDRMEETKKILKELIGPKNTLGSNDTSIRINQ